MKNSTYLTVICKSEQKDYHILSCFPSLCHSVAAIFFLWTKGCKCYCMLGFGMKCLRSVTRKAKLKGTGRQLSGDLSTEVVKSLETVSGCEKANTLLAQISAQITTRKSNLYPGTDLHSGLR